MAADPLLLPQEDVSTETIDVNGLLTTDMGTTGSYDLRSFESTSFGKLFDAIPLPVLVVDQWHYVVFANQACDKSNDDDSIIGRTFEDLVPTPPDAERAHELTHKAVLVLENAFDTRKPLTTEAILQLGKRRRWYRLHLRSVRLASQRHVLVVMEDLTSERTHQRISRREEQQLRNQYGDLSLRHTKLVEKSRADEDRLSREIRLRKRAEAEAQAEREKLLEILRNTPVALAIVGHDGTVTYSNAPFEELFNEGSDNFLNDRPGQSHSGSDADCGSVDSCIGLEALKNNTNRVLQTSFFAVPAEGGEPREVQVTTARLSSGEHVIICGFR
jgi:PAS domain-containing protein